MTLAELIVAASLTTAVAGAALCATIPLQRGFAAYPEAAGLTQRARVVAELLSAELRRASLVLPFRAGDIDSDIPQGVFYRPDVVTAIADPLPAVVRGWVTPAEMRTYHLKQDAEGVWQLMQYNGQASDAPAVEDVVELRVEYFGESQPPAAATTEAGDVRVSYGAPPPPLGIDDPADAWGAGENCIIASANGAYLPRLIPLGGTGVVPLPPGILTDGPWCPDDVHTFRFDADLLRVRRVRVSIRVQAAAPFRGASGRWFAHGGSAGDPARYVPDETFTIDVAPRNIDVAR